MRYWSVFFLHSWIPRVVNMFCFFLHSWIPWVVNMFYFFLHSWIPRVVNMFYRLPNHQVWVNFQVSNILSSFVGNPVSDTSLPPVLTIFKPRYLLCRNFGKFKTFIKLWNIIIFPSFILDIEILSNPWNVYTIIRD